MSRRARMGIAWPAALPAGLLLLLAALLLAGAPAPAAAQPPATPTPDADGVIYVVVQPNDALWSIAARAGLTLAELLALNGLAEDALIQPGQRLIIGYGPTPTTAVTPTATFAPPTLTPTPAPPRTAICVLAFDDANRNGVFDAGEALRAGVAFTIYDRTAVVANLITDGVSESHCVEGLAPGDYVITRSVGRSEVLTTDGEWALTLPRGGVINQAFGGYLVDAAPPAAPTPAAAPLIPTPPPTPAPPQEDGRPTAGLTAQTLPLLGCMIGLLILAAVLIFLLRNGLRSGRFTGT